MPPEEMLVPPTRADAARDTQSPTADFPPT
jgi:hypothetical protein